MDRPEDWRKLLAGEKGAWDRFVQGHAGVIFGAVRGQLVPAGRSDDVVDVVQEVFLKLCRNDFKLLRSYDPARAKVTTWLTVIATTTSIDHLRKQRSGQRFGCADVLRVARTGRAPRQRQQRQRPGLVGL